MILVGRGSREGREAKSVNNLHILEVVTDRMTLQAGHAHKISCQTPTKNNKHFEAVKTCVCVCVYVWIAFGCVYVYLSPSFTHIHSFLSLFLSISLCCLPFACVACKLAHFAWQIFYTLHFNHHCFVYTHTHTHIHTQTHTCISVCLCVGLISMLTVVCLVFNHLMPTAEMDTSFCP